MKLNILLEHIEKKVSDIIQHIDIEGISTNSKAAWCQNHCLTEPFK